MFKQARLKTRKRDRYERQLVPIIQALLCLPLYPKTHSRLQRYPKRRSDTGPILIRDTINTKFFQRRDTPASTYTRCLPHLTTALYVISPNCLYRIPSIPCLLLPAEHSTSIHPAPSNSTRPNGVFFGPSANVDAPQSC